MAAFDSTLFAPLRPLARVTVRHSATGAAVSDVLMLLDYGADVTLIPIAPIHRLGIALDPAAGYELMGFNGMKSVAPAVQLDLVFLRRAFIGRYVAIEQSGASLGATF